MAHCPEGWAVGYVESGGPWLTVPGSTYRSLRDILHPTREAAEADRAGRVELAGRASRKEYYAVRYVRAVYHPGVTVTETAFRIIEPEPAEVAAFLDTPPVTDAPRPRYVETRDPDDEDAARARGPR